MYILDEIDAALDLSHTQNIGVMLKTRPLFRNTLAGFNLNLLARRSIGGDKKAVAAVSIYLYSTAAGSSHVAASSVEPT